MRWDTWGSVTDKITAIENVDGRVVARITEAMDRIREKSYRLSDTSGSSDADLCENTYI